MYTQLDSNLKRIDVSNLKKADKNKKEVNNSIN
jgi:hypothetical protein